MDPPSNMAFLTPAFSASFNFTVYLKNHETLLKKVGIKKKQHHIVEVPLEFERSEH